MAHAALRLSAAPGCCARLVAPPNWLGQLRYAVPSLAGRVMACAVYPPKGAYGMANQTPPSGLFDSWKDFIEKSSAFWSQAAAVPQPPDPAQMWRQFLSMWSDFWSKTFTTQTASPDMFQTAQKLWSEQLETLAQGFANVMGTDAFSNMQSKFFEQTLAWQDRAAKAANPQIDMALRALNLPSREQIDRLFERIIGIEERLDDLEDNTRQILRRLRDKSSTTPPDA